MGGHSVSLGLLIVYGPIVQRIERKFPKLQIWVRFPVGLHKPSEKIDSGGFSVVLPLLGFSAGGFSADGFSAGGFPYFYAICCTIL